MCVQWKLILIVKIEWFRSYENDNINIKQMKNPFTAQRFQLLT